MEYASVDELLEILDQYKIRKQDIPIKHQTYCCGYVKPKDKVITLNSSNQLKSDIETVSHELTHLFYDVKKNMNLSERKIEELALVQLDINRDYHKAIYERVNEVRKYEMSKM